MQQQKFKEIQAAVGERITARPFDTAVDGGIKWQVSTQGGLILSTPGSRRVLVSQRGAIDIEWGSYPYGLDEVKLAALALNTKAATYGLATKTGNTLFTNAIDPPRAPRMQLSSSRYPYSRSGSVATAVRYFQSEEEQQRALKACRTFLRDRNWPIGHRLLLYPLGCSAFSQQTSHPDALGSFTQIWNELRGWQVFRPCGPGCSPEEMFQMMKAELADFRRDGPVTLPSFRASGKQEELAAKLERFRRLKPTEGLPVMAISKFFHPYNPRLFPIYDNAVIRDEVLRTFRSEFRAFCAASSLRDVVDNTATFYVSYMSWGSYLLELAHSRFMQVFADWLDSEPTVRLAERGLDGTHLQATAYEFTLIGAYEAETAGTP